MNDWFTSLADGNALAPEASLALVERGFVVIPGPVPVSLMGQLACAYDQAVVSANAEDVKAGRTTTRVNDFVNRGPQFDSIYLFAPLLEACSRVIGRPFKLSSFHARTLSPRSPAQELHMDVHRGSPDWPLLGFIFMIDDFRPDNGATRFVPGSQKWRGAPEDVMTDRGTDFDGQALACGPAGSLIVFNGSAWHGHTANRSDRPRRSLQGAFIPRDGCAQTEFSARMSSETLARLSPAARIVLGL